MVAFLEALYSRTHRFHHAGTFMPPDDRHADHEIAFDAVIVGVA